MRYWWVNQKQTYRHEVPGGYMWSPKRKSNGHRNPFYEFMREVAPGDIVFSFADGLVKAIGAAVSHGYESPKPLEFGEVGAYWNVVGWRVDVQFRELKHAIRPADYMDVLGRHLPRRYAPLQPSGHGLQSVYLTELPESFATDSPIWSGTKPALSCRVHRSWTASTFPLVDSSNGRPINSRNCPAMHPSRRPCGKHWCRHVVAKGNSNRTS